MEKHFSCCMLIFSMPCFKKVDILFENEKHLHDPHADWLQKCCDRGDKLLAKEEIFYYKILCEPLQTYNYLIKGSQLLCLPFTLPATNKVAFMDNIMIIKWCFTPPSALFHSSW